MKEETDVVEKTRVAYEKVRRNIRRAIAVALPDGSGIPMMSTYNGCARPSISKAGIKINFLSYETTPVIEYQTGSGGKHAILISGSYMKPIYYYSR